MSRIRTTEQLIESGVIAVIRMKEQDRVLRVAEALLKGGVRALEVTMTVPGALGCIEAISRELGEDALPGVGSVIDADTAHAAIDAGASYVLSPVFKREVIEAAHARDCPAVPGAFTPTEILEAHEAGADFVKVFPADILGMAFFKGVLAPLPFLRLIPTGGVSLTNAGDWIRSGAAAVGIGSALLDREAIASGDYDRLTEHARQLTTLVRETQAALHS